jgi:hypothetical protein
MRTILAFVLGFALAFALTTAEASAHTSGYTADENGDGYLTVHKSDTYRGGWVTYKRIANSQLRASAPDQPRLRMVDDRDDAELWIVKNHVWEGCPGTSDENPGRADIVAVSADCSGNYIGLFSHEVGHIYGLPDGPVWGRARDAHHPCTPYWQKRSVNVGETRGDGISGCAVKIAGFGGHDLNALAK